MMDVGNPVVNFATWLSCGGSIRELIQKTKALPSGCPSDYPIGGMIERTGVLDYSSRNSFYQYDNRGYAVR